MKVLAYLALTVGVFAGAGCLHLYLRKRHNAREQERLRRSLNGGRP